METANGIECFSSLNKKSSYEELSYELTKRLIDRQVCFNDEHGCSWCLGLLENVTSPSVQTTVDTTNGVLGTLKRSERPYSETAVITPTDLLKARLKKQTK